jgi:dTMP kinase
MESAFITLEGGEGSGKSTQGCLLYEWLRQKGYDVILTAEPTVWLYDQVFDPSTSPMGQLFLFLADRAQHIEMLIRPALAAGKIVVCDRYVDSTVVYQAETLGLDVSHLDHLNRLCVQEYMPDLTFFLNVPTEEVMRRLEQRPSVKKGFDSESSDFHTRIRDRFRARTLVSQGRIVEIDGTQPPEAVQQDLQSYFTFFLAEAEE